MPTAEVLVDALQNRYPRACADVLADVEEVFDIIERAPLGTVGTRALGAARDLLRNDQAIHDGVYLKEC